MVHVHLTVITGFHIQSVSIDHAGIPHMGRRQGIGEIPPVHMYIDSDTLSRTHRHQDCLHIYRRGIVQCVVSLRPYILRAVLSEGAFRT